MRYDSGLRRRVRDTGERVQPRTALGGLCRVGTYTHNEKALTAAAIRLDTEAVVAPDSTSTEPARHVTQLTLSSGQGCARSGGIDAHATGSQD